MKKDKIIATFVISAMIVSGMSVFANRVSEENVNVPKAKFELTEEHKAERKAKMQEKAKAELAKQLEEGKITQAQYDERLAEIENGNFRFGRGYGFGKGRGFGHKGNFQKKELTEEQKTQMKEKAKAELAKQLEEGKITQAQYDEKLSEIENGNFRFGRGYGFGKGRGRGFGRGGHRQFGREFRYNPKAPKDKTNIQEPQAE